MSSTLKIHDLWTSRAAAMTDNELAHYYVFYRQRSRIRSEGETPYEIMLTIGQEIGKRLTGFDIVLNVRRMKAMTLEAFEREFEPVENVFNARVL